MGLSRTRYARAVYSFGMMMVIVQYCYWWLYDPEGPNDGLGMLVVYLVYYSMIYLVLHAYVRRGFRHNDQPESNSKS